MTTPVILIRIIKLSHMLGFCVMKHFFLNARHVIFDFIVVLITVIN